jgi:imidazole glycerol-phosphate synthase subunit HisH
MIAVVDYGAGNLASVQKALELAAQNVCAPLGALTPSVTVTSDPAVVASASAVVLPGVGAFGEGMEGLRTAGLEVPIAEAFLGRRPFLGICLGLQLLFEGSEESPDVPGLALIAGRVRKFGEGLKVPHMGWNQLHFEKSHPVFAGVEEGSHVYFVHSYCVEPTDTQVVATLTDYGGMFCSAVAFGRIMACQFHPEKSQDVGLRILENFVRSILHADRPVG